MADFLVYSNNSLSGENYPYLLDVQSDLLSRLDTRLVIPLMRKEQIGKATIKNLNPIAQVNEENFVVMTQQMAAIPKITLGERIENANIDRTEILTAIDFLITGI